MHEDNKRIAKNTMLLYMRSLLIMAISIYTSRVVLKALGIEDYGLYGVVGTVVATFTILNGVFAAGTSRFLTYELGKGDSVLLRKTFSAAFFMHLGIAIVVALLLETVGLWFLNTHINIPEGREAAANWVYQFSVLSCFFSLTQVPYSAVIIAHEKMGIYAYIGIFEAVFKLVLPLVLIYGKLSDNLIAYGAIIALWSVGLQIFYRFYCVKHFPESKLVFVKDKKVYKNMLSYSLWDFLGQMCGQTNAQGVTILINIFFGVTLNAAQSVAMAVETKVEKFVSNFMVAVNPQIVKSYAQNDYKRFFQLISEAGRYSYFLFLFLSLPIFIECDYILNIWLEEVPRYTSVFLRFTLAIALFRTISRPVINGVHATGNVKFMNLTGGLTSVILMLPGTYLLFKTGFPFWSFLIIKSILAINGTFWEVVSLYRNIKFDVRKYLIKVYFNVFLVSILSIIIPTIIVIIMPSSFIRLCTIIISCLITTGLSVFFVGFDKPMRVKMTSTVMKKLKR